MQLGQNIQIDPLERQLSDNLNDAKYDLVIKSIPQIKKSPSYTSLVPLVIKAALQLNTIDSIESAMDLAIQSDSPPRHRAAHAMLFAKADRMTEAFIVLFADPKISWLPDHATLIAPVVSTLKRSLNKALPAARAAIRYDHFIRATKDNGGTKKSLDTMGRVKSNYGFAPTIRQISPKLLGPPTVFAFNDVSCAFQKDIFSRGLEQAELQIHRYRIPEVYEFKNVFLNRFGDIWRPNGDILKRVSPPKIILTTNPAGVKAFDTLINACAVESSKNPYLWCTRFLPSLAWRWELSGQDIPVGVSDTAKPWVEESIRMASKEPPVVVHVGDGIFVNRLLVTDVHMYFLGRHQAYEQCLLRLINRAEKLSPLRNQESFYISRRDANRRAMLNEAAFEKVLEKRGIKPVVLSKLNFADKVNLFRSAPLVVGAHGAGFANLIFGHAGRKIVEIIPTHTHVTLNMAVLSRIFGHSHYQYITVPKRAYDNKDWEINIPDFIDFLDRQIL